MHLQNPMQTQSNHAELYHQLTLRPIETSRLIRLSNPSHASGADGSAKSWCKA